VRKIKVEKIMREGEIIVNSGDVLARGSYFNGFIGSNLVDFVSIVGGEPHHLYFCLHTLPFNVRLPNYAFTIVNFDYGNKTLTIME